VKLSELQEHALRWLTIGTSVEGFRVWSKLSAFSPDKRSLLSCVKRGLAEQVGMPSWERYALTDLGRSALAEADRSQREG